MLRILAENPCGCEENGVAFCNYDDGGGIGECE